MTAFRDFFRRRRVRRHIARHGPRYPFHGVTVELPPSDDPGPASALLRGKYEAEEAALILAHLPPARPVIELGGSMGVISRLIRSRLDPGVPMVVVEANPALIETCRRNAVVAPGEPTEVLALALSHDGPSVRLRLGDSPHANRLARPGEEGSSVEVPATTLAALWDRLGQAEGYTLVSDIEGAEADLVMQDGAALAHADAVLMELHPAAYGDETATAIMAEMDRLGFDLRERRADVCLWRKDL